jgi:hypothetical protein
VALRHPRLRAREVLAAGLVAAVPAVAWGEAGADAFERRDYLAATELWRAEAAEGSTEAKFGLGLIYDLGLGVPRNSAAALRWYLEAASDGHADAQFNVAVMLDAGTGVPRDPAAAATWYARSAANGNARAQFNLAMLYEDGVGIPKNPDLARVWYEAASSVIGAAADRLAQLPSEDQRRESSPPQVITGSVVGPANKPRAELVWSANAGLNEFQVQIARQPSDASNPVGRGDEVLLSQDVRESAVVLDVPASETKLFWRVGRVDQTGTTSAWSSWQELSRETTSGGELLASEDAPAHLTIYVNEGDQLATSFAEELSHAYSQGGIEVAVREANRPATTTTVEYRYPSDAALAASIAAFLPVLGSDSAIPVSGLITAPGEVTLRLVGGPRPLGQADR